MGKSNRSRKCRKYGRNRAKCERYKKAGQREKNKARKALKQKKLSCPG